MTAALLASLWALTLLAGPYGAFTGLAGVALLLVLFSFDQDGYRSGWQSLAFGAVCGFCASDVAAYLSRYFAINEGPVATDHFAHQGLAVFLASATLICWAIDRARMSARQPAAGPVSFRDTAPAPSVAAPVMAPVSRPAPSPSQQPPPPFFPVPAEAPAQPPFTPAPQPQAAPVFEPAPLTQPAPVFQPSPVSQPAPVPQPAASAPTGKETSIYVTLVGEGLNIMRSVRAEHLGRDFYKITDVVPEGETWEYQPGQVVRARKKNLSSGKALVAVEEAPRTS